MTTELMQLRTSKQRNVFNMFEWRNATSKSRHRMYRRQVKMNRVVKRLAHTLYLSAARSDKQMNIDSLSQFSD
jgi:hypothetical protein